MSLYGRRTEFTSPLYSHKEENPRHPHPAREKPQAREEVIPSQTFLSPGQERLVKRYVDPNVRFQPPARSPPSFVNSNETLCVDLLMDMRHRVESLESTVRQLVGVCRGLLDDNNTMKDQILALKVALQAA